MSSLKCSMAYVILAFREKKIKVVLIQEKVVTALLETPGIVEDITAQKKQEILNTIFASII